MQNRSKDNVLAAGWTRNLYMNRTYSWSKEYEDKLKVATLAQVNAAFRKAIDSGPADGGDGRRRGQGQRRGSRRRCEIVDKGKTWPRCRLLLSVMSVLTLWLIIPVFVLPPLAFFVGYKAYRARPLQETAVVRADGGGGGGVFFWMSIS